jgi:hypothetical protein
VILNEPAGAHPSPLFEPVIWIGYPSGSTTWKPTPLPPFCPSLLTPEPMLMVRLAGGPPVSWRSDMKTFQSSPISSVHSSGLAATNSFSI